MAATNFFERQDKARRATRFLVVWFALAVLGTAAAIYAVVMFAVSQAETENEIGFWNPEIFAWTFGGTLLLVGCASLFKSSGLGDASGEQIARELGGVRVNPNSGDPVERRLINVVQEMSIASGVPMPKIFILQRESSINAFAAGTRVECAAIAVSRGALEKLSRDELQAVVGHEFSHILNGDMRLNVKLIGWIFGLVVLAVVGRVLMQLGFYSGNSRSRKEGDGAIMALSVLGIVVFIVGVISQFFAGIIQAAISRHRERLADASATQFTRNPIALANALSRIGGDSSILQSPRASEYSHFFFASGVQSFFATHPPLEERIRALNPSWNGKFLPPLSEAKIQEERREFASNTDSLNLRNLTQTPEGARALVLMLMMTHSPDDDSAQAVLLHRTETPLVFRILEENWEDVSTLPPEKRLGLVMLAAPKLRDFPQRERIKICETLKQLAEADGQIALFEFLVIRIVHGVLFPAGNGESVSLEKLLCSAEILFALVMRENAFSREVAQKKLAEILTGQSFFPTKMQLISPEKLTLSQLENAFDCLRTTPILFRENLIRICAKIAEADETVSSEECDLLNAISLAFSCPLYRRIQF